MRTGAKRLDASSTDAKHWAECVVEEISKRRFDEADFIAWFANYWAAVHDPLANEVNRLRKDYAELHRAFWLLQRVTLPPHDISGADMWGEALSIVNALPAPPAKEE